MLNDVPDCNAERFPVIVTSPDMDILPSVLSWSKLVSPEFLYILTSAGELACPILTTSLPVTSDLSVKLNKLWPPTTKEISSGENLKSVSSSSACLISLSILRLPWRITVLPITSKVGSSNPSIVSSGNLPICTGPLAVSPSENNDRQSTWNGWFGILIDSSIFSTDAYGLFGSFTLPAI